MIAPTGDDITELRAHPFGRVLTEPQLERLFVAPAWSKLRPAASSSAKARPRTASS